MSHSILVLLIGVATVKAAVFGSLFWAAFTSPPPPGDGGPDDGGGGHPEMPPPTGGPWLRRRPPPTYGCSRHSRATQTPRLSSSPHPLHRPLPLSVPRT